MITPYNNGTLPIYLFSASVFDLGVNLSLKLYTIYFNTGIFCSIGLLSDLSKQGFCALSGFSFRVIRTQNAFASRCLKFMKI